MSENFGDLSGPHWENESDRDLPLAMKLKQTTLQFGPAAAFQKKKRQNFFFSMGNTINCFAVSKAGSPDLKTPAECALTEQAAVVV